MSNAMFRIEMFLRSIGVLPRYRLYCVETMEFLSDYQPVPEYYRTLRRAKRAAEILVHWKCTSEVEILAVIGSEWIDWESIWTATYSVKSRIQ